MGFVERLLLPGEDTSGGTVGDEDGSAADSRASDKHDSSRNSVKYVVATGPRSAPLARVILSRSELGEWVQESEALSSSLSSQRSFELPKARVVASGTTKAAHALDTLSNPQVARKNKSASKQQRTAARRAAKQQQPEKKDIEE